MTAEAMPDRPALRIVKGSPTPAELAVVAAVLAATGAGADAGAGAGAGAGEAADQPAEATRRGGWNDPAARHRPALLPGPNAWRAFFNR